MFDWLELKVPPIVYFAASAFGMWGLRDVGPFLFFSIKSNVVAGCLIGVGIAVAFPAIVAFVRAKTTINPHAPSKTTELVTTGIYRITRNPMYLGLATILCGGIFRYEPVTGALCLAAFIVFMTRFQIKPEEHSLEVQFGQVYREYKARVRRWI